MWGQVQGILTGEIPCKLAPMNYYIKKKLHFYHFYPTLTIKEGVHILVFFLILFRTIISLIIATQTVFTLQN